ncbi:MAG: XdhC family protein [Dehalococcoidales bacterium]|nr:MAG: XdhC family protein [Dehalococcoidales bacterium]
MNTDILVPKVVFEQLESGHPVVLVSVVDVQGSSPRHQGAKMVISNDGQSYGTIGGSLFEARAIQEARDILAAHRSKFMDFDLADNGVDSTGMICGGKAVVLLDYISVAKENIELFRYWHDEAIAGNCFYFLTHVSDVKGEISISGHSLLFRDGQVLGYSPLTVSQLNKIKTELRHISSTIIIPVENTHVVVDPIRNLKTLYCFGAGHVAVPTAHMAAVVGFRVIVIDDRVEFANTERFPDAEQIYVIKDYGGALKRLEVDKDSFIVIMTRGHQYDGVVLEQALKTEASYIGMISSRTKRDTMYQAMLIEGIKKQELERVHSPIGIDIGSETPEEIAVSIVAELIKERARRVK